MTVKPFESGQDPRKSVEGHQERGPKRFAYTYADIAEVTGLAESTVKTYASQGKYDPESLQGVVAFVLDRRTDDEPDEADLAAQRREIVDLTGIGFAFLGLHEGIAVWSMDHAQGASYKATRDKVERKLIEAGYLRKSYELDNGETKLGWAKVE